MEVQEVLKDGTGRFTVESYPGVAFAALREETAPTADTHWDGIEEPTGNVVMVMVGDDREFTFEPDEVHPLDPNGYCPGCGQVGCSHYGEEV